jgi:hypothetical protein
VYTKTQQARFLIIHPITSPEAEVELEAWQIPQKLLVQSTILARIYGEVSFKILLLRKEGSPYFWVLKIKYEGDEEF